ncbi:hypothetical protein GN956_G15666 [Arapaima gigas]
METSLTSFFQPGTFGNAASHLSCRVRLHAKVHVEEKACVGTSQKRGAVNFSLPTFTSSCGSLLYSQTPTPLR